MFSSTETQPALPPLQLTQPYTSIEDDSTPITPTIQNEIRDFINTPMPPPHSLINRTNQFQTQKLRITQLESQVSDLQEFKSKYEALQFDYQKICTERDIMSEENQGLKQELETVKKRLEECEGMVKDLKGKGDECEELNKEMRRMYLRNERLESDIEKAMDTISNQDLTISTLRRKLAILIENNTMKQKMIQSFESKISGQFNLSVNNQSLAALREFQANRLKELFDKSKKHLEVERRQNDTLRKNLYDTANATLITNLKDQIAQLQHDAATLKLENSTLRNLQKRHEKYLKVSEQKIMELEEKSAMDNKSTLKSNSISV
ncbi:hypothetical protein HK098_002574 [Nowakowskiella sp. JEL0407]|nr:hypothetical protein HK098_002574 [Nowakowskiella sp. JEL0407]